MLDEMCPKCLRDRVKRPASQPASQEVRYAGQRAQKFGRLVPFHLTSLDDSRLREREGRMQTTVPPYLWGDQPDRNAQGLGSSLLFKSGELRTGLGNGQFPFCTLEF